MTAAIVVKVSDRFIVGLLWFRRLTVTIDGVPTRSRYTGGDFSFAVAPGAHEVSTSFRFFLETIGQASLTVNVPEGATVELTYVPPFSFGYLKQKSGTLAVGGVRSR